MTDKVNILLTMLLIVVIGGAITLLLQGCSVKVLTFGADNETVQKEYFIGKKETK